MTTATTERTTLTVACVECGTKHRPWVGNTVYPRCRRCRDKGRSTRGPRRAPDDGFHTLPATTRRKACEEDPNFWEDAEHNLERRKTPWHYIAALIPEADLRCSHAPSPTPAPAPRSPNGTAA